ncbi:hypothetical protein BIV25_38050 [Streptomyces sp. MUSC 14]|uniref:hypothetical protein n=1 Tax=Streptomyces sp. MUSC 14 TaxID=1354889 RepID=UPI0008F5CA33|nr:hypothetical protein [Streptomyces sp. MUSC 14]OIJ87762.1 hypothetical protein BIV25_38050 [Streptomyces sp. MUSC 14]
MAWDEWEQLKAAAADRSTGRMQIDHLADPVGGGGVSGKLRSDKAAWSKVGGDVGDLRGNISKALAKLADGQKGLGKDSGCLTTAAQREVHTSWEHYVGNVSGRCEKLSGLLDKVGNDQLRTDEAISAEIAKLKTEYKDTPAVGGQSKGR